MACRLFGAEPSTEAMITYCQLYLQWNMKQNISLFIQQNAFEHFVCKMPAFCRQNVRMHSGLNVSTKRHNNAKPSGWSSNFVAQGYVFTCPLPKFTGFVFARVSSHKNLHLHHDEILWPLHKQLHHEFSILWNLFPMTLYLVSTPGTYVFLFLSQEGLSQWEGMSQEGHSQWEGMLHM